MGGTQHIHLVSAVQPLVSAGSQDTQGKVSVFMELHAQQTKTLSANVEHKDANKMGCWGRVNWCGRRTK